MLITCLVSFRCQTVINKLTRSLGRAKYSNDEINFLKMAPFSIFPNRARIAHLSIYSSRNRFARSGMKRIGLEKKIKKKD